MPGGTLLLLFAPASAPVGAAGPTYFTVDLTPIEPDTASSPGVDHVDLKPI